MCEACNGHLIEEHLRPLVGRGITTRRDVLLKVESLDAEKGRLTLRKVDTRTAFRIPIWDSDGLARAHSFIHHGGIIEGIHVPGDTSLWSRFNREYPGYFYAILESFYDIEADERRSILKGKEQRIGVPVE